MNNPRKLRVWDSKALTQILQVVTQFQEKIYGVISNMEKGTDVSALPPSLVPTDMLFDIAECYIAMYEILETEHLIKSGNAKPTTTIH
jgi:hypothetical protein